MSLTGGAFLVNGVAAGRQVESVSANSPNGNSVVVWSYPTGPTNYDLRARVYNAAGIAITNEINLPSTANTEYAGGVGMDAAGNFVVVWTEEAGLNRTCKVQRYSASGTALGAAITVTTTDNPGAWSAPRVAVSPNGSFVVVSPAVIGGNGDPNIRARLFSPAGELIRTVFVSAIAGVRETEPSVAMDAAGRFAVAYRVGSVSDARIELKQFAANGDEVRTVAVSSGPTDGGPSVGMTGAGSMVVAWHQSNGGIRVRRVSADGAPGNVLSVAGAGSVYPVVAVNNRRDNFVVGYTTLAVAPTGHVLSSARLIEINSTNQIIFRAPFVLATGTGTVLARLNSVSITPDGRYLVTYEAGAPAGTAGGTDTDGAILGQFGQLQNWSIQDLEPVRLFQPRVLPFS